MEDKLKVMLVFGTRPEAIKMAPVYHALKAKSNYFETSVCVTAQHRHMLDQVLSVFEIIPDIDLNLMKPGQDLFDITSNVLLAMRDVLNIHRPDVLLVHGDTTTTMATSVAAFYTNTPIGHIEAGLRTHNLRAPFPEEFNRQMTTKLARWHFAPTSTSRNNLLNEHVSASSICITGNTVIDALIWVLKKIEADPNLEAKIKNHIHGKLPFDWENRRYILITGHRRENFGDGFLQICNAVRDLAVRFPEINFVYPVHLNPSVQKPVNDTLNSLPNVHLIQPLDYEPFLYLLKHCYIVLTDSGGIQEEAPSLGKPVLVMRDVTERPEAVDAGTVKLVGANHSKIVNSVIELLNNASSYTEMSMAHNPYGDGHASERIANILANDFGVNIGKMTD